jgi:hypothetical protein
MAAKQAASSDEVPRSLNRGKDQAELGRVCGFFAALKSAGKRETVSTLERSPKMEKANPPKMFVGTRPTVSRKLLSQALQQGVKVTESGGWSNKPLLDRMVDCGYMVETNTGPRGGRRYNLTSAGLGALGVIAVA